MLTDDQIQSHQDITRSLEQCEVWAIGDDPDIKTAASHLLDALDEITYQFNQLEA